MGKTMQVAMREQWAAQLSPWMVRDSEVGEEGELLPKDDLEEKGLDLKLKG